MPKIHYTKTDEAPALATLALLPILKVFGASANIEFELRDISLAGRILAQFPEYLKDGQRVEDDLHFLGELAKKPEANIIKLPNISASIPQLEAAIAELQAKGYAIPSYPIKPKNAEEEKIKARYDKVKGSAVNPVLREGNSDRRAPKAVKEYARKHPHSMGAWSADSQTEVVSMSKGDFFGNEKSFTSAKADTLKIVLKTQSGEERILKDKIAIEAGEIVDSSCLQIAELLPYIEAQINRAKASNLLLSLHLKATMMKVSDPILFGHVLKTYFSPLFKEHGTLLESIGVNPNNGLGDLYQKLERASESEKIKLKKAIESQLADGPDLAMVNSDKGITNLHVPSDVIIDASVPAMIRSSGKMWDKEGKMRDTLALIPDRSYAGVYQTVIEDCKKHGAYDPTTMGSVANVGLMAKKAEEYGSHDKTFEISEDGEVLVLDSAGNVHTRHMVKSGDIWRMCTVKDDAVRDWVQLAIKRVKLSGQPAIFWLDADRPHDAQLIQKVRKYRSEYGGDHLDMQIAAPAQATQITLERLRRGEDTISVTGNVLRDYLTDLFPILEVGTSAKMLSIVPLMQGGGLFETGAGGSAPKHVEQFLDEGHLRWDSLGEFLAIAASLDHIATVENHPAAAVLSSCLDKATGRYLEENKSPSRVVNEPDNRSSRFFLIRFWAEELAAQNEDKRLKELFGKLAQQLLESSETIERELLEVQGKPVDIGGYYYPDEDKAISAMRPSQTLDRILTEFYNSLSA